MNLIVAVVIVLLNLYVAVSVNLFECLRISVRQATISLSLLLSQGSPLETCESLWSLSATTPRVDFHHRYMTWPSYKKEKTIIPSPHALPDVQLSPQRQRKANTDWHFMETYVISLPYSANLYGRI